jgi:hypothetical protein
MNVSGVILLFRYGMPYRVRTEGVSYYVTEDEDKREIATEQRYGSASRLRHQGQARPGARVCLFLRVSGCGLGGVHLVLHALVDDFGALIER